MYSDIAPRFKHSFSSLSNVILKQPKGIPYSEILGQPSEGLPRYDGTTWSLQPRIIDEDKGQKALNVAMVQNQNWRLKET